ncbi:granzyme B-like [Trichomycterus rosablanca]|uniref:granzyme B-like n=1 Tax=Trichomycterus rosablanca TaxID=2290929 RepID=UPI002F36072F
MALITLIILTSLLQHLTHPAYVDEGIVGGRDAAPHSRPYMVSVQKDGKHICGGFLVSKHFVMTAAHCWSQKNLTVVLGVHSLSSTKSELRNILYYHIYPAYDSANLINDIMLLQLSKPVDKSPIINWVSLPKKNQDIKAEQLCSIAGWGTQTENGKASKHLMEVNVTTTDISACKKFGRKNFPTSRLVCTKGHGGFCKGDSGGPLVCKNTAVGIISFNDGKCDVSKKLYVYTKISKFLPWINAILERV